MALTGAQTQTVYEACGLRAQGGSYRLVRFDAFSTSDIEESSLTWDYSNVKSAIDSALSGLGADAETRLGTYIATCDATATSSLKVRGEVEIDHEAEHRKARRRIVDIVGVEVAPRGFIEKGNARQGRAVR